MKKLFLIVPVAVAIVAVLGFARHGQGRGGMKVSNNPSYPLQVITVSPELSPDSTQFRGAKVTLQNAGVVPCNGFAMSFIVTFNDGETESARWQEDHIPYGYSSPGPAADRRIMPMQTYSIDATGMTVASREPATIVGIETRIDYIEMADGKTFGDDQNKARQDFRMNRFGHRAERKRLLDIYKKGGVQALLSELQRQ